MQVILRPEITMEPYAYEPIFWFIARHGIKTYMGYSGYGGVCMKVMSRSTWNRSLLVRRDHILCILILRWLEKSLLAKSRKKIERVSNASSSESSLVNWESIWICVWVWHNSVLMNIFRVQGWSKDWITQ